MSVLCWWAWLAVAAVSGPGAPYEIELGPPVGTLLTVDRLEGEVAVVEAPSGWSWTVPRAAIPPEAREGDVLRWTGTGPLDVDPPARARAEADLRALIEALLARPGAAPSSVRARQKP